MNNNSNKRFLVSVAASSASFKGGSLSTNPRQEILNSSPSAPDQCNLHPSHDTNVIKQPFLQNSVHTYFIFSTVYLYPKKVHVVGLSRLFKNNARRGTGDLVTSSRTVSELKEL
jgi:hypothetical protein